MDERRIAIANRGNNVVVRGDGDKIIVYPYRVSRILSSDNNVLEYQRVTRAWGIDILATTRDCKTITHIEEEVDTTVETIEEIVDIAEKVAEVVDKMAENISDALPKGGKLRKVVDVVEDVAEETAKDAQTVGDVIDKLQEVEKRWKTLLKLSVIKPMSIPKRQKDD
ncbi:hypothetical protein DH2020_007251 [Rehmannia glutinosa]|uniref:Uncharacterized protein n=1 Tax=Rehmannia glutinosa TaxID=99300 RepID=A0ABR0TXP2_REHGL